MTAFDDMIKDLHGTNESTLADPAVKDGEPIEYIRIGSNRIFEFIGDFNKTIAYEGDVNSQIITFELPTIHEGHQLYSCNYKTIRWANKNAGTDGVEDLIPIENTDTATALKLQWVVPPEAFLKAGPIDISISIYDLKGDKIAFSWNTPICSELKVQSAGDLAISGLPKKTEVLTVDFDTKKIIVPSGYNTTIANLGDENTSIVYFQMDRCLRLINNTEIALDDGKTTISLLAVLKDKYFTEQLTDIQPIFVDESYGEGMVLVEWQVPPEITNNTLGYTGAFSIMISIKSGDKIWNSSPLGLLTIGSTLTENRKEELK